MTRDNIIVGLDVGTSKIAAIIGDVWPEDPERSEIIGVGVSEAKGLRKGVVVNIEKTANSIREAVEKAEQMSGVNVGSVYAGIAGGHISGITTSGVVAVSDSEHEITQADVNRAIEQAQALTTPVEREVLHVIPQGYTIDDQKGIKEPVGMYGVKLIANVHIITGAVAATQNVVKSVFTAGLSVENIVLQPLASSQAILTNDEREMGVVLVDIGDGTTDIVLLKEGAVRHTKVLPLGGWQITNDIAILLSIPPKEAENLKKQYGCALVDMVKKDERITLPSAGRMYSSSRTILRSELAEIIECRIAEILDLVAQEVDKSELLIPSGIVITGGTSLLEGLPLLAEEIFDGPVRIGYPKPLEGLTDQVNSPIYATGVGLVLFGARHYEKPSKFIKGSNLFSQIFERMKNWFEDYI